MTFFSPKPDPCLSCHMQIGEKEEQSTKMSLAVVELQAKLPLARVV